jgi:hypothetical protein
VPRVHFVPLLGFGCGSLEQDAHYDESQDDDIGRCMCIMLLACMDEEAGVSHSVCSAATYAAHAEIHIQLLLFARVDRLAFSPVHLFSPRRSIPFLCAE